MVRVAMQNQKKGRVNKNKAGENKSDDDSDVYNDHLMNINFLKEEKNSEETISINSSNDEGDVNGRAQSSLA